MNRYWVIGLAMVVVTQLLPTRGSAVVLGALTAGAARVEITPDPNALPRPFTSIHDPLYDRAIFLENGHDRAVLLNADVGGIGSAVSDKVSTEISQALNVPAANILISATHDNNAIFGGSRRPGPGTPPSTAKVLGSSLKPGCAEPGIVNGVDSMIEKLN